MNKKYDLIILGSGPAGLTAGIYAMRAKLDTLLLEKDFVSGGQVLNTYEVDNYPGLPQITGIELGEAFEKHARNLNLPIEQGEVTGIFRENGCFRVETDGEAYRAAAIIVATGTRHRTLDIPGEAELTGMGVSYCATCDGAFFKEKTVAVVGGGDTAVEDAIFLARICEKVYLIHRRDELRAARILQDRLMELKNVEILWNCEAKKIIGDQQVTGIGIDRRTEEGSERLSLDVDGIFIAVGVLPNNQGLDGIAETDPAGYLVAGEDCKTSTPGIFAAGDIRTKTLRQIVTAAADGANASASVLEYLNTDFHRDSL